MMPLCPYTAELSAPRTTASDFEEYIFTDKAKKSQTPGRGIKGNGKVERAEILTVVAAVATALIITEYWHSRRTRVVMNSLGELGGAAR